MSKIIYSIIIVSYNNIEVLVQTLKSIISYIDFTSTEIVVVDNASKENNVSVLKSEFSNINIVENDDNLGFGKANNVGAKVAKGKYLFFVNGDIILKGDPFKEMISVYESTENIGLLGAQLLNKDGTSQPSHYGFPSLIKRLIELLGLKQLLIRFVKNSKNRKTKYFEIKAAKGAFFLTSKKIFDELGGFDEYYFMYIEDIDLSFSAIKSGYKNFLFNSREIIHLGNNHESAENLFIFENRNRGQIYFYKKFFSRLVYLVFILMNITFFSFRVIFSFSRNRHEINNNKKVLRLYINALRQND